jgi:hypothetical protein
MARSRSRKQSQPESKKALIIFLVFFILTTIGGAFFGYQGFTADENNAKKVKDAQDKAAAAETEREFYMYQALLYRRLLGHEKVAAKGDLDKMDAAFQSTERSGWANHKDRKDVEDVRDAVTKRLSRVVNELNEKILKRPDVNKPIPDQEKVDSYEDALRLYIRTATAAVLAIKPHVDAKGAGLVAADESKQLLDDAKTKYEKALNDLTAKVKEDQQKDVEEKQKLKEALDAEVKKNEEATTALAKAQRQAGVDLKKRDDEIAGLAKRVEALTDELARTKVNLKDVEVPDLQVKPVGRVVDRRGDAVFINLGTNQKMTPQTTFSIHALGSDGQPLQASKGSLEVTQIFESGSQAKILVERNKNDPIQQGDVIANPNWNPDRKRHVAIAGLIDLTGEGRNQVREFRQLLERQNVIVDVYLEPGGNNWMSLPEGKSITRDTNYLIVGDELPESKDPMNPTMTIAKTPLFQQARQKGVFVVSLNNYLDMIGYQPPRSLNEAPVVRPPIVAAPEKEKAK